MLEIKNPHTRKRLSVKEKFEIKFTDFIIPHIGKIQIDEKWNAKNKFVPKVLEDARANIEGWKRRDWSNALPENVDLNLLSVYVAEYIPIENVDDLNKGLKKLIKKYPASFQFRQADRVDEFCKEVKESIHGGRWSDFGAIEFSEEDSLSEFVKSIHINGTHLSSSSIILQFVVTPSENFVNEYKQLVERNVKDRLSFNLTWKNAFKSWGAKIRPNSIVKKQMLEDYIIELKWRTMKEISKHFDLYFTKNKMITPSIEVHKLKQDFCVFKQGENESNNFWNSIGFRHFSDISKNGYWMMAPEEISPDFIDNSIKITCNSFMKKDEMFHSLDFQMIHKMQGFAEGLLPIMIMREYTWDTSKKVAFQQNKTFSSIKKHNPNHNKLIKLRHELEQNLQILKRFKNEIGENYFERVKSSTKRVVEFDPRPRSHIKKNQVDTIVDNTSYIIDKTFNHSQDFAKLIDDTSRLLEIKTNNSLRRISFSLTITTVVLSIIATTTAILSFYLQLDDEIKDNISNFFNSIIIYCAFLF